MGSPSRRNWPATFTSSTSVKTRAVLALNIYHQMIRSSHMYMIEINSKSISPASLATSSSSRCGDCDIRLWAVLLKPLQPIPQFPAHMPDNKPAPSCKLFKFPTLDAIPEQA
jgi:hypothetical protein